MFNFNSTLHCPPELILSEFIGSKQVPVELDRRVQASDNNTWTSHYQTTPQKLRPLAGRLFDKKTLIRRDSNARNSNRPVTISKPSQLSYFQMAITKTISLAISLLKKWTPGIFCLKNVVLSARGHEETPVYQDNQAQDGNILSKPNNQEISVTRDIKVENTLILRAPGNQTTSVDQDDKKPQNSDNSSTNVEHCRLSYRQRVVTKSISLANDLVVRVKATADWIFKKIQSYAEAGLNQFIDFLWPYDPAIHENENEKDTGFFSKAFQRALKKVENGEAFFEESKTKTICISQPVTTSYAAVSCMIPILMAKSNAQESFANSILTSRYIQNFAFQMCYAHLDQEFLKKYGFIPEKELDTIDSYLHFGAIAVVAQSLNTLTGGILQKPLHFAATIGAHSPHVQQAVSSLPLMQSVSQKAHDLASQTRKYIKKPIRFVAQKMLVRYLQTHGVPYGSLLQGFDISTKDWDQSRIGNIGHTLLDYYVGETFENRVGRTINAVSDTLAEGIIDCAVDTIKASGELYFFNKMLVQTCTANKWLGVASLIMAGGTNQSTKELVLRTAGSAILIFSGSTFWPLLLIYGNQLVEYAVKIRGKHIKRMGWQTDPAVDTIKKNIQYYADQLKNWVENPFSNDTSSNSTKKRAFLSINC